MFPQADLVTGFVRPGLRDLNDVTRRARETWLARVPGVFRDHRWLLPLEGLAFSSLDVTAYDLVISSSHAFSKMVRRPPHAIHLCYCYSPPRYLWDLRDAYKRDARGLQYLAFTAAGGLLRQMDRRAAQRVDRFVAISHYVAARVRRSYGREADVVFPPVAAKPGTAKPGDRRRFVLYLGRLVPYKRVDVAIEAAERLGIRLVIAGDGPDRGRLEGLAGPHTEFLGRVSEEQAAELMSACAAFVFCADEDFGMAPVEANAHGAPVVAYARGGVLETMIEGTTAVFFHQQTAEQVQAAITEALSRNWDRAALARNAARFAPERFREGFLNAVVASFSARG